MKLLCLVTALAFLAAPASDSWGQSQEPPRQDSQATKQQSKGEDQPAHQPPAIIKEPETKQTEKKAETGHRQRIENWFDGWSLSDKIAVIASVVAFLQFLALIATVFVMRRTAQRQLRAYVCLDGGSITLRRVEQETFFEGYVSLKNCGATPAYDHSCWIRIDFRNAADLPFDIGANGLTQAIIGPDSEVSMPVHHGPLSADDLANLRNETKRVFVWGRSDYRDAFGKQRFFKFYCWNAKELPGKGWPLIPADKPHEAN